MKVGDYVRTKSGYIGKITSIDNEMNRVYYYTKKMTSAVPTQDIVKYVESKEQIINLIKEGDYVNGREVRDVYDLGFGKCYCFKNEYGRHYDKTYKIKSIVTREMFESMKYKVGD